MLPRASSTGIRSYRDATDEVRRRLGMRVVFGATAALGFVLWSMWPDVRGMIIVAGLQMLRIPLNLLMQRVLSARQMRRWPGWVVTSVNLFCSVALAHFGNWTPAVLLYIPFENVVVDVFSDKPSRLRVGIFLAVYAACALIDGVSPAACGALLVTSLALHGIGEARVELLSEALRKLEQSHAELGQAHDELALMHRRLVQQEKLSSVGMMAAQVAHELNNPLAYVTGNLQLLSEDLPRYDSLEPEARREYLEEVVPATLDGLKRMNAIITDLRHLVKSEPDEVVDVDINEEVRAALRICDVHVRNQGRIEAQLSALPAVRGRRQQMAQVVVNLVVNAGHALPAQNGVIRVETRRDGGEVVLEVRDNGSGLSPEARRHLFEPFFTTKNDGTGLGLATVRNIVQAHGGSVAAGDAPGGGTIFTVRLPGSAGAGARAEVVGQ